MDPILFTPDWIDFFTAKKSEQQIIDFKFKGEGWYFNKKKETILVIPTDMTVLVGRDELGNPQYEQTYKFCVWNHDQAPLAFNWIVNAPVKEDRR